MAAKRTGGHRDGSGLVFAIFSVVPGWRICTRCKCSKVPLAQELELVDDYLAIEEIRFEDRLQVNMTVDPGALDGLVPCFLLQPIVENAIRHGISRCEESGVIQVTAERRDARLYLAVRDSGPGTNGHSLPGNGIGLKNTRERLSHFYQEQFAFAAGMPERGGFEVTIDIPYERAAQ
jgi:LytS/YehU family sensor histidine kinase